MDQQGDGELPVDVVITRFQENMQIESVLEKDLRKVIMKMDKNGDGYIQY
jgi:Ca2+-binding EF-hand superfamily protein